MFGEKLPKTYKKLNILTTPIPFLVPFNSFARGFKEALLGFTEVIQFKKTHIKFKLKY